jgi:hypothetical protein
VGQRKRNEPKWQCAYKNNQRPPKGWGEIAGVMAGQGQVLGWRVQGQQVCEDLDSMSDVCVCVCVCVCVRSREVGACRGTRPMGRADRVHGHHEKVSYGAVCARCADRIEAGRGVKGVVCGGTAKRGNGVNECNQMNNIMRGQKKMFGACDGHPRHTHWDTDAE